MWQQLFHSRWDCLVFPIGCLPDLSTHQPSKGATRQEAQTSAPPQHQPPHHDAATAAAQEGVDQPPAAQALLPAAAAAVGVQALAGEQLYATTGIQRLLALVRAFRFLV